MSAAPPRPEPAPAAAITRPATRADLPALLAHLDRVAAEGGVGDDVLFPLHLAVEEACANVIAHGYPDGPGPLTLAVEVRPDRVAAVLTDEARPFRPSAAPAAPTGPVEGRAVGGLGWHLIREATDEIHHETTARGGNRLTLVKRRPPPHTP